MIYYVVNTKTYDDSDLPQIVKDTLKKNDALKGMFIMSCGCGEKPKKGDELIVTYQTPEFEVVTVQLTLEEGQA